MTTWLARERLNLLLALYPAAHLEPALELLAGFDQPIDPDSALSELLRARLSGHGPQTQAQIAAPLGKPAIDIEQALARLEAEGYVLRGHFSPGATDLQWCERHLLARIHRYTVKRLRREIEPVSLQDFMRFLFDWQHLAPDERLRGPQAVAQVLGQLQGSQRRRRLGGGAAAGAHRRLQPALARRCLPQRAVCLEPAGGNGGEQRLTSTPLVLLPRDQLNTGAAWRPPCCRCPWPARNVCTKR
jgi:ATP-dependent Lhr-like helicase